MNMSRQIFIHTFDFRTRIRAAVLIALVALCITGCAPPAHYGESAPAVDYYPLAVGDQWTYEFVPGGKKYSSDVTESKIIDGTTTFAMAINSDYSYMAVQPNGIFQYAQGEPGDPNNAIVFEPPQRMYRLPFVGGASWNTPALIDPGNPKSDKVQLYGRVETFEDVTVPAGHFTNCVRVLIDDPRDTPSNLTELWFAPNVGIVKTETTTQREKRAPKIYQTQLVSYKLK